MRRIIMLLFLFTVYQRVMFSQIKNPNLNAAQRNEIKLLSKSFVLLPGFPKVTAKLGNPKLEKMHESSDVKSGGINTSLIEIWQNNEWVNNQLTTYKFDLNNHETGNMVQYWRNNNWENSIDFGTVLNEQYYPVTDSLRSWEDSNWVNQYKHIYYYNSNNDVKQVITMSWNDTTKSWRNLVNMLMNYDDEFKVIESLMQTWDGTNWAPLFKEFFYYNDVDSCKGSLSQLWMVDKYIDYEKITRKFNEKNLKVDELYESWQFYLNKWATSRRYQYEYNNSDQEIVKYDEEWDLATGDKKVYQKISTTYTGKYIGEELTQEWKDSSWVNTDLNTYTYEDDCMTLNIWQKWDDTNNNWYNFERWTFTYIPTVEVEEDNIVLYSFSLKQNYPNPFNPTTTISYTIGNTEELTQSSSKVELNVYDILGNLVTTLVNKEESAGNYEVQFNAENLSSGLYLYKLSVGNRMITKKCLLIK